MNIKSLRCTALCRLLIALLGLAFWPGTAEAEDVDAATPLNAHMKRYGGGRECDRGYRRVGRSCVALRVLMNAHLGYSGNVWTYDPGYRQQGETCTEDKR